MLKARSSCTSVSAKVASCCGTDTFSGPTFPSQKMKLLFGVTRLKYRSSSTMQNAVAVLKPFYLYLTNVTQIPLQRFKIDTHLASFQRLTMSIRSVQQFKIGSHDSQELEDKI
eukprot:c49559_g1_i1 orf=140-478(+)